jgi:site-specific DNA-methyltransferase (adenine-specific)
MMFTDPPYNVAYEGNYIQSGKILGGEDKMWNGNSFKDSIEDFSEWLKNCFLVADSALSEGAAIYIWHPSGAEGRHFWSAWPWDKWHFQVDLVWNKLSLIIARWDYKPQHEPVFYGWKGKNRSWIGPNNEPTVLDFKRQQGASGETRLHPTSKPVELCSRIIKNHAAKIVYEPFSGSGTTILACEQLGRKCRAIEISPGYVAVAIQRWADATGKEPKRL